MAQHWQHFNTPNPQNHTSLVWLLWQLHHGVFVDGDFTHLLLTLNSGANEPMTGYKIENNPLILWTKLKVWSHFTEKLIMRQCGVISWFVEQQWGPNTRAVGKITLNLKNAVLFLPCLVLKTQSVSYICSMLSRFQRRLSLSTGLSTNR